jgi:hypothetical protein
MRKKSTLYIDKDLMNERPLSMSEKRPTSTPLISISHRDLEFFSDNTKKFETVSI